MIQSPENLGLFLGTMVLLPMLSHAGVQGPLQGVFGQDIVQESSRSPEACFPIRVVDADTVDCDGQRVRLLGIDAPESFGSARVYEQAASFGVDVETVLWMGRQATAHMEELIMSCDRPVLIFDGHNNAAEHMDHFGRTLAYLDCGETDLGEQLVFDGWADLLVEDPLDSQRLTRYIRAYRDAMALGRGMWGWLGPSPGIEQIDDINRSISNTQGCFVDVLNRR